MATFKVKTFNELSGKGQNGDIAIIERADVNGNKGFSFRDASGWALPFVQVQSLGANLMTTNTSQSVSAPKTFQGEVVINDDFSVIGATDIDLGFTSNFSVDAGNEPGSQASIQNVEYIELLADEEVVISGGTTVLINAEDSITLEGNDTDTSLNISGIRSGNVSSKLQLGVSNTGLTDSSSKARFWFNRFPTDHINTAFEQDGAWGVYFRTDWLVPTQREYVGLQVRDSTLRLSSTTSGASIFTPLEFSGGLLKLRSDDGAGGTVEIVTERGGGADVTISDSRATKKGIEYAADYSANLKTNARSLIDAGTMTVMLEDYIAAVPTYADNAAAVLGGLAVGKMYKTATGELRIVV